MLDYEYTCEIEEGLASCTAQLRGALHALMDDAWALNRPATHLPFPVSLAEKMRATLIAWGTAFEGEAGRLVAECARKGYWLERQSFRERRLWIWHIDHSNELGGDNPAVTLSTMREVAEWIRAAPFHEFEGSLETAHQRIRYPRYRQHCISSGVDVPWN